MRRAAAVYKVPEATLRDRIAGKPARIDCQSNSKKFTKLEEEVVVGHVLDLALRGFPASLEYVRYMAGELSARGGDPVCLFFCCITLCSGPVGPYSARYLDVLYSS